ncbi:MAG TPA: TonB-dependent receptor [Gemmatimonadaceae bacterium]|nr:TonB-dependent receptor [Gemmatimonadaceae bacterium]
MPHPLHARLAALVVAGAALPSFAPALAAQQRPQSLDSVRVVVGSRAADLSTTPFRSAEVLDRAAIDRLPALTLGDLLARALGADIGARSAASADLSIRGSSFEQVGVLVDGVRVSDEQTGHFDLDLAVPLAAVERIEVLRGAGSALYGPDAVGGVVNVVTRRVPSGDGAGGGRVEASARGGSFGTGAASLAAHGAAGGVRVSAAGDYQRSDGHRAGTDYEMVQARAAAVREGRLGAFQLDAGLGLRAFGADGFYGAYPSHERTTSATAAARWEAPERAGWRVTTVVNARRHGDRFTLYRTNPAAYQNRHASWQAGSEVVARRAGAGPLALALGAEGYGAWLDSERLGDHRERRAAAFAEATATTRRVGANAGLRADWSSEYGAVVTPSLAVRVEASDAVALRASASGGHRNPTWTDRFYSDPANVGDPALRPERFWAGEVGAQWSPASRVGVDAVAWVRRADRLIDWARPVGAPASEPWRTRNVEDATFTGLELSARLADVAGADWTLRAATTDVDARDAAGWVGRYALRPLTRQAALGVSAPVGARLTLGADAGWAGHAGEEAFFRADARLAYRAGRARLVLDGTNLTGADYLDASGLPVAGRGMYFGIEWR